MSSSSINIGYTKLIEMNIETDPPGASKPYTLLQDLEKAGIIQRSLFMYASPIGIMPRKCQPGSPVQETKRLCVTIGR